MIEPRKAVAIGYSFTDAGSLLILFLDNRGMAFASAQVSEDDALGLSCFIVDKLLPDEDDTIGEVAGHA